MVLWVKGMVVDCPDSVLGSWSGCSAVTTIDTEHTRQANETRAKAVCF